MSPDGMRSNRPKQSMGREMPPLKAKQWVVIRADSRRWRVLLQSRVLPANFVQGTSDNGLVGPVESHSWILVARQQLVSSAFKMNLSNSSTTVLP